MRFNVVVIVVVVVVTVVFASVPINMPNKERGRKQKQKVIETLYDFDWVLSVNELFYRSCLRLVCFECATVWFLCTIFVHSPVNDSEHSRISEDENDKENDAAVSEDTITHDES